MRLPRKKEEPQQQVIISSATAAAAVEKKLNKMFLKSSKATPSSLVSISILLVCCMINSMNCSQSSSTSNSINNYQQAIVQQQQLQQLPISQQEESELIRQKQHIQYHDQWPHSMAGKCRKRTLNFCASVLPFNSTTFPNIIGDTNRFEVKRSLPFFGFLAKSSCNKRLDELLCLLLEPPCQQSTGTVIPPCKKFCRLALEGCGEYIPATLAMSSVFDCRQYPDSSDPNVCINLASGSRCAADEFKCPDKTCIPKNWLCDGVRDCLFAADEANCTAPAGSSGPQASVCSTEEFKCDGKCVPKAWKCDGERDCLDGTDEESCDRRPRCGPDRFRCADGNGCLPKRWVCDGKAECRDGSDELNCESRECSENDFKCDNGICIPKIWKCDRQFDCKDGSDERNCVYPTTSTTTTTTLAPTTMQQLAANVSSSFFAYQLPIEPQQQEPQIASLPAASSESVSPVKKVDGHIYATEYNSAAVDNKQQQQQQQLGASLNEDVSRIIQQESSSSTSAQPADLPPVAKSDSLAAAEAEQLAKEMKKFDYDLLPASSTSVQQTNSIAPAPSNQEQEQQQQQQQQVEFVQQQQPPQQQQTAHGFRRRTSKPVQSVSSSGAQQAGGASMVERVPIYRSLFKKALKSSTSSSDISPPPPQQSQQQQQPQPQQTSQPHRYAVRRRRDRNSQQRQQRQHQQQRLPQQPPAQSSSSSSSQQATQTQLQEPARAAAPILDTKSQSQSHPSQSNHGVASYLQLLNNRYNFRLSRHQQQPHSVFVPSSSSS